MIIIRLLALFVLTLSVFTVNATPITWDFESLHGPNTTLSGSQGTGIGPAFEYFNQTIEDSDNGFKLSTTSVFGGFISYNPGSPLYGSSVELIPNTIGRSTTLTKSDLSSFSIFSIDLGFSNLAQQGNGNLTFNGIKSDNSLVTQTFSIESTLLNYSFSSSFNDLVSLSWLQTADAGHRFDNINIDGDVRAVTVPEPMTFLLLIVGLLGLGLNRPWISK